MYPNGTTPTLLIFHTLTHYLLTALGDMGQADAVRVLTKYYLVKMPAQDRQQHIEYVQAHSERCDCNWVVGRCYSACSYGIFRR
jgi:hypothetical protein